MHYLIGEFLLKTVAFPITVHDHNPECTKAIVIVETRPCFWLPYVIANAVKFNPEFNLYVFGTQKVLQMLENTIQGNYVKIDMPARISVNQYSAMLLDTKFWSFFKEQHVLIFQTDCVFVRPIPVHMFEYDYIGAVCGSVENVVMNGGLSLRRRDAMIRAIELMDDQTKNLPEDIAFSITMNGAKPEFKLPTLSMCNAFALESLGDPGTAVGMHGTDKFYIEEEALVQHLLCSHGPKPKPSSQYHVAATGLEGLS